MPPAEDGAQEGEAPKGSPAIRSYLTATLTPVLLKALVELDKEERDRPVVWLAQYLADYSE